MLNNPLLSALSSHQELCDYASARFNSGCIRPVIPYIRPFDKNMDLLFEIYQNAKISQSSDLARSARDASQDAQYRVIELEQKTEMLLMLNEALWEIIKKSHKLNDEYLIELIREIDLKDGKLDGKVAKSGPRVCAQCGKTIQKKRLTCMYCGETYDRKPFER